jgi:hypothetical protein
MDIRKIIIEVLVLCTLLSSCASTEKIVSEKNNSKSGISSSGNINSVKNTTEMKHYFKNDDVIIKVDPAGDRMYFSFTNNSNYRILLHLDTAKVFVRDSDKTSNIVTFEQSKMNTSHFQLSGVVVNPKETFTEKYVALDAMKFDAYKTQKYVISEWAFLNDFQLEITYGIVTNDGEILNDVVIN